MKKNIFSFLLILGFGVNAQSQSNDRPANPQSGKCYAKCTMPESTTENPILAWEEVICADKITGYVISDIVNRLIDKGYKLNGSTTVLTKEIKVEISKFQKEASLPVGNLNLKTLDALGVRY